jgi:hypothetical protein
MLAFFFQGLVFGAGFSLAAILIAFASYFVLPWDQGFANQTSQMMEESMKAFSSAESVKVITHERVVRGDEVVFLGTLKNDGQSVARNFSIAVELFDTEKKFVESCREAFYGSSVKPGEVRNFKVSCSGCRNRPVPEHATYEIHISSSM